jgi:hypothetical protein
VQRNKETKMSAQSFGYNILADTIKYLQFGTSINPGANNSRRIGHSVDLTGVRIEYTWSSSEYTPSDKDAYCCMFLIRNKTKENPRDRWWQSNTDRPLPYLGIPSDQRLVYCKNTKDYKILWSKTVRLRSPLHANGNPFIQGVAYKKLNEKITWDSGESGAVPFADDQIYPQYQFITYMLLPQQGGNITKLEGNCTCHWYYTDDS